jgi:hypothetical protein
MHEVCRPCVLVLGCKCFATPTCSRSRKVLGLTPTEVFALARPKSPIDRGLEDPLIVVGNAMYNFSYIFIIQLYLHCNFNLLFLVTL